MIFCKLHAFTCVLILPLAARAADVPQPLDRASAIRVAAERSQTQSAARAAATAARVTGDAEGRLPDPEIMAEAWQVPIQRPLAFGDASMLAITLRQSFPAPGVLSARTEAREAEARAIEASAKDRSRGVEREAGHAFVDLQVAEAKRATHVAHRDVAARLATLAQARLAAGAGRLSDVATAEVERARLDADVALEGAMADRARAKLNGLLRRELGEPLTTVPLGEPEMVDVDLSAVARLAAQSRPELAATRARREAETAMARAAEREGSLPAFTVGVGYYAPTTPMPMHGYGVSVGATLPWVWGSGRARARARAAQAAASTEELGESQNQIRTEAASALAEAKAAARRFAVLWSRAKPAAGAALEIAISSYQSGQGEAASLYRAERDVVEVDVAILDARSTLAHALVDLDWAVGAPVARVPLPPSGIAERVDPGLGDHIHGGAR